MISVIDEHHLRVGDRTWFGHFHSADTEGEMEWKMRQFIVRFESKWSVSVVWGYCTYSDNHDFPWHIFQDHFPEPFNETPMQVEAAVLHHDREHIQPDGEPFAYIDADSLNALLSHVSKLGTSDQFGAIGSTSE